MCSCIADYRCRTIIIDDGDLKNTRPEVATAITPYQHTVWAEYQSSNVFVDWAQVKKGPCPIHTHIPHTDFTWLLYHPARVQWPFTKRFILMRMRRKRVARNTSPENKRSKTSWWITLTRSFLPRFCSVFYGVSVLHVLLKTVCMEGF